jgi:glyoxylase-like metal-dependent hydrolase (beta-lactamase superfamily II)
MSPTTTSNLLPNRRSGLRVLGLLVGVCVCALAARAERPVFAAAPMAKTAAPGFYRFMLGDFEITALSDGTVDLPFDQLLKGTTPAKVNQMLAKAYLKSPVETSLNAFLINTGSKLVLVDTGAGALFGPTLGRFLTSLKASGYKPEQVDEIYITHMHPDHVGGLTSAGKIVFPNAIVRADKHESDYWLSQANLDKAPADAKAFFEGAMASLKPYVAAGKYKEIDGPTELVPGVKSLPSKGHTAGHTSYVVESKGQKLVLVGDVVHVLAVQFDEPAVTVAFDYDQKEAQGARHRAFTEAAKDGSLVGAAHLPFPGVGHVRVNGKGFQWLPINFARLP